MEVTVKAFLQVPDGATEVRRISLILNQDGTMFQVLAAKVAAAFPDLNGRSITISWQDSDDDYVLMSSDEELQDALAQVSSGVLKVFVTDIGQSETQDDEMTEEETGTQDKVARHDWEMPKCPMFRGRGGRGWMRGRGHHHGPHGGPIHGGPFHGHHEGPFHGPHHGPWNRMNGPPAGPFHHPFVAPGLVAEIRPMGERRGWKRALRESVPVSHRRWAKIYIHNWRCQNIANATTTSTDSEQDRRAKTFTKEVAGVPEAYTVWLDMILPKFHQQWETSGESEGNTQNKDDNADSMATLRMSVPVEFREWAQWFLTKRYGKRRAPEFRKRCGSADARDHSGMRGHCGRGQGHGLGKHGHGGCRGRWAGAKLGPLAKQIPRPVRLWAKHFIFTWQLEQQVPVVRPQVSDSEDLDVPVQGAGVPEDYGKWLLKFLPHWHACRGLLDRSMVVERTPGDRANFKATVPQEFRAWVKCYLAKHFQSQNRPMNAEISSEHQRWLQVFKTKWLQQREATTDLLWVSSSEDNAQATTSDPDTSALTSDPDTDVEVNSSFKRMRLEANKQKSVQFAEDSDSDAANLWGKKPGPAFRQFAKGQLTDWDGVSTTEATDDTEIPPHVHRWLCRMMVKMEEKKMRHMKKAGKRETRLAKKELKAIAKAQKNSQS